MGVLVEGDIMDAVNRRVKELSARTQFLLVVGCMIALQTLDGVITTAVTTTGWARETNPILVGVADQSWFWLAKVLITAIILGVLYWRMNGEERHYRRAAKWLAVVGIAYIGIVAWNAYCLYTLQTLGVFG